MLRLSTSRRGRRLLGASLLAIVSACGGGDRSTDPPTEPPGGPDTTGTIQRATLTVRVSIDPADAAIAAALGLAPTSPSGLRVQVSRSGGSTEAPRTATTDASGVARFEGLLEGTYAIGVERSITDAERAALTPTDRDVTAIAGGTALAVRPGTATADVVAVAGRRGSLVISEVWPFRVETPSITLVDGGYLELYNNGDTTVFLDGMVFGVVPYISQTLLNPSPENDACVHYVDVRNDSTALGLGTAYQFPGGGTDYPLAPGAAVIIATDAIDHRPFGAGMLDLSRADFELIGDTRDVDNPAVPNLTRLRTPQGTGPFGHGLPFGSGLPDAYVIAKRPTVPLERRTVGLGTTSRDIDMPFVRREDVLDVMMTQHAPSVLALDESIGTGIVRCAVPWHPVWDRAAAPINDSNEYTKPQSFVRRIAYTRDDGRVVLQRTRTSARDWVYGPPATPGRVR